PTRDGLVRCSWAARTCASEARWFREPRRCAGSISPPPAVSIGGRARPKAATRLDSVHGTILDDHSLKLLEFDRVAESIASRASSDAAREALVAWRPIADGARRMREN